VSRSAKIIVVEHSPIIREGLKGVLNFSKIRVHLSFIDSFEELKTVSEKESIDIIIINPSFVANNPKAFDIERMRNGNVKWIGLVYAYYDSRVISMFDSIISISDTADTICSTIDRAVSADSQKGQSQEVLSEREIEILKLIATGMANKEIADKLNISINTVITHRKNISQKTGIKSVSGLTIYAVVQKLVSIESL